MYRKLPVARTLIVVIALFLTASSLAFANFSNQSTHEQSRTKKHTVTSKSTRHTTPTPTKSKSTPTPTITLIPPIAPISPTTHTSPFPPTQAAPTPTTSAAPTNSNSSFINEINSYRQSQGLGPVQESSETCAFAAIRAQEIATNFSHDGFSSRTSSRTLPYASWSSVTENIAMTSNSQNVVNMWINSPGHAENMRKDTPFVCIRQSGNYFAYEGMKP